MEKKNIIIAGIGIVIAVAVYTLFFSDDPEVHSVHAGPDNDLKEDNESEDSFRLVPFRELVASSHHPLFSGPQGAFEPTSRPRFPDPELPKNTNTVLAELDQDFERLEELIRQNRRQTIITLADDAIGSGNRDSFSRLQMLAKQLNDQGLVQEIHDQVLRVDRYFYRSRGIRTSPLPASKLFPEVKSEDDLTNGQLLTILVSSDKYEAEHRCRAAYLLGLTKPGTKPRIPGYLLHAAKRDPDLTVVDESLHSFSKLTGVDSARMFDYSPASVWWQLNNPERKTAVNNP